MSSQYYLARYADALGLCEQCPTNVTMLAGMDLITAWGGTHSGIAVDAAHGFDKLVLRRCTFPTPTYPFLCTGSAGNPGTDGRCLGSKNCKISYKGH